jgi:hypothetical protein
VIFLKLKYELTEEDLYHCCNYTVSELEIKTKLFLKAYAKYGVIGKAAEIAGINRGTVKTWRNNIKVFDEAFKEIEETYTDTLELEANRRALEKSDSLLQFLLRARRPDKFNPTQKIDANVETTGIKLVFTEAELNPEEKKILEEKSNGEDEE